jgi:hypothetical protein
MPRLTRNGRRALDSRSSKNFHTDSDQKYCFPLSIICGSNLTPMGPWCLGWTPGAAKRVSGRDFILSLPSPASFSLSVDSLIQLSTSSSASLGHTTLKPLPQSWFPSFRNMRSQQQSNESTRSRLRPNPPHGQTRINHHHSACDDTNDSFPGTCIDGFLCVVFVCFLMGLQAKGKTRQGEEEGGRSRYGRRI